jgi:SAM-dependent methyltransferase
LIERLLRRRAERLVRLILPELPAVGPILDLGSGTGHNADFLRTNTVLDAVEADVVDLHWVGRGPVLFDGRALPFRDAAFSASILLFVLQYAADPESLLRETRRVTSGRVMVLQSTYNGSAGHTTLRAWEFVTGRFALSVAAIVGLVSASPRALRPKRFYTRQALEQVLGASGFRVSETRRLDALTRSIQRDLYVLEPAAPCP